MITARIQAVDPLYIIACQGESAKHDDVACAGGRLGSTSLTGARQGLGVCATRRSGEGCTLGWVAAWKEHSRFRVILQAMVLGCSSHCQTRTVLVVRSRGSY